MHSSRIRTARLLPVSPSMHCAGRVSDHCGGVCSGGVSTRGCLSRGCLPHGGFCLWSREGDVYPSMQWGRHPLWTERHLRKHKLRKLCLRAIKTCAGILFYLSKHWTWKFITSFNRTFGCPIICTDTYSQCYFGHWHLQQCLIQSSSLVGQDAIFVDKS